MAERIEIFDVTVPAGTTQAAPLSTALAVGECVVERIEMRWPPGPSGLVGLRIAHSGQPIIPHLATSWLVTDDEPIAWPVQGYPTGDAWTALAYNSDVYSHTIQIRMLVNEIPTSPPTSPTPLTIEQ